MNGALLILKKDYNIMKNSNFKLSSTLSISCFCAVINLVNASTGAEDDRGNIKFHQRNTVAEANRTSDNNRKIPPLDFNKLSVVGLGHLIMDSLFNAMINGGYKSTKEIEKCDEFGNIVLKSRSYTNFQFGNIKNNTKEKGHQSKALIKNGWVNLNDRNQSYQIRYKSTKQNSLRRLINPELVTQLKLVKGIFFKANF